MEERFDYIRIASLQVISNVSSTDHHISDRIQSEIIMTHVIDGQQQHELNPPYSLGRVPQQSTASNSS
jgi:hypothetical protein